MSHYDDMGLHEELKKLDPDYFASIARRPTTLDPDQLRAEFDQLREEYPVLTGLRELMRQQLLESSQGRLLRASIDAGADWFAALFARAVQVEYMEREFPELVDIDVLQPSADLGPMMSEQPEGLTFPDMPSLPPASDLPDTPPPGPSEP